MAKAKIITIQLDLSRQADFNIFKAWLENKESSKQATETAKESGSTEQLETKEDVKEYDAIQIFSDAIINPPMILTSAHNANIMGGEVSEEDKELGYKILLDAGVTKIYNSNYMFSKSPDYVLSKKKSERDLDVSDAVLTRLGQTDVIEKLKKFLSVKDLKKPPVKAIKPLLCALLWVPLYGE